MTTKPKAKRCVTHHACDCHQYQIEQMRKALAIIQSWAKVDGDYIESWMEKPALDRVIDAGDVLENLRRIQKRAEEGLEKVWHR